MGSARIRLGGSAGVDYHEAVAGEFCLPGRPGSVGVRVVGSPGGNDRHRDRGLPIPEGGTCEPRGIPET